MSQSVRAKFKCESVKEFGGGFKEAQLWAVSGSEGESKDFSDATPSGQLTISISGDVPASEFFKPGEDYYLDFTKAE